MFWEMARSKSSSTAESEAPRNWVKEMAATASAVISPPEARIELERLSKLREQMLPVEDVARLRVDARVEVLRAAQEIPYPKLSLEPLSWSNEGRPVFAVYSLASSTCYIGSFRFSAPPKHLPSQIEQVLISGWTKRRDGGLSSEFTGVFPADVRTKITAAESYFTNGRDIYIIAEANWKAVRRPAGDPLVVGWRGESLWLIAQFDTTDLESYYSSEFPG